MYKGSLESIDLGDYNVRVKGLNLAGKHDENIKP